MTSRSRSLRNSAKKSGRPPDEPGEESGGRRSPRRRRRRHANLIVAALAVAAAVGAALAGDHPTGSPAVDIVYSALLGAGITVACSRATRGVLLVATTAAFAMSRSWLWIPAGIAMALAFATTFPHRSHRRLSALIGAIVAQVILRWPPVRFHGSTAVVAAALVLLISVSAWRHSRARVRRRAKITAAVLGGLGVVFAVIFALSTLLAKGPAEQGVNLAQSSLSQISSGRTATAQGSVRQAASDLHQASEKVNGWWNLGSYLIPGVAQQERALGRATRAGADLTATAARLAADVDYSKLRIIGGRIDLAALAAMAGPVAQLHQAALNAQGDLDGISSPWLVEPLETRISKLRSELARSISDSETAVLATQDLPSILGQHGVRRYFVGFMTPSELRGLGGFLGAYGVLTVDNGSIHLTVSGRPIDLKPPPGTTPVLSGPPSYVARYGSFHPELNLEDVTYAPDFPTVEQVISELYPQLGGQPVDGALVLDPYALAALLNFTGPVTVPGLPEPLTPANAAEVLLRQQYLSGSYDSKVTASRHDALQAALRSAFSRLTTMSLPSPTTFGSTLGPVVAEGRLLFWSSHPSDQPLIERLGLSGALPRIKPGQDFLAVTLANGGNSKIDAYLHESINDSVTFDPTTGHVHSTVAIQLDNGAPGTGLPAYVIGNSRGVPPGSSLLWVSIYTPLRVSGARLDGTTTALSPGTEEDGLEAYSTFVLIPSSTTDTLTVSLDGTLSPGAAYTLGVRQQPLASAQTLTVGVRPAPGSRARVTGAGPWTAGRAGGGGWSPL
jgi:hypothetical protein